MGQVAAMEVDDARIAVEEKVVAFEQDSVVETAVGGTAAEGSRDYTTTRVVGATAAVSGQDNTPGLAANAEDNSAGEMTVVGTPETNEVAQQDCVGSTAAGGGPVGSTDCEPYLC